MQGKLQQSQGNGMLNQQQMNNLRFQTQALKHLQANEPVPTPLQNLVLSGGQDPLAAGQTPDSVAQKIIDSTFRVEKAVKNPASLYGKQSTTQEQNQRLLLPAVLPHAIDPKELALERERYLRVRVEHRIKELSELGPNLDGEEKIKALIELKSLKLLEKQKTLRGEILASLSKASTLATALDRSVFRRMKKQSLREARQTEKQERALRGEKDKRERQKHLDYVNSILAHGRDWIGFHRTQMARHQRLGGAVLRFHAIAVKEEEKRMQRHSQERLNALKANDEEAYLKLLDKTKDTRITTILEQTNTFLTQLTNAVETQKSSVGDIPMDNIPDADDANVPKDYYATAHKIQEIVTEQSTLLVGGTLKEYQVKGLQWMVSLYNNRLNGILADEMVRRAD
ncbi:hypothetical protein HDU91_006750 [Kappamyces sp. JEL0680]|nr:hypothetical protein HDU91_006750 [Kappamyces sp. JEL0680]